MDPLNFLDESAPADASAQTVAETPVEAPAPEPVADAGQPRSPDGKFAAKAPAPAEAPASEAAAPQAETPAPAQPETPQAAPAAPQVPLAALLDTRDELKALKAELEKLRAEQPKPQAPTGPTVDPDEDPRGAWEQSIVNSRRVELDWSKRLAVKEHGEEAVNAAYQWGYARCDQDPVFNARVAASQDPYGLIMQEHQQHQLLVTLQDPTKRDRLLALLADEAAPAAQPANAAPALQAPAAPPQSAPTPPQAPLPPRSIASAPTAGTATVVPVGPGQAFDATFR